MRWLLAAGLLVVLSGCTSQTSFQGPDCIAFCNETQATIHYDWVPPVLLLLFVVVLVVLIAATAGGRERQQQQQQVVIHVDKDGEVRQR